MINPPDIADLPPGYRFGNYVILERIGRGGMARVYRAEHVALNKHVALKVMDLALNDKAAAHRQFMREGRAAAAVKHPNVVDITDVGVWQGMPYLVMELLEGWDLETHLRERGFLPDAELVRLALPLIAGLAVAHDAGVVHRDLKPSNIFLAKGADGDQVPKVLDFGISKLARDAPDLTATPYGAVMGTPLYLPPEALGGIQGFTTASDQYSLGVVLYECVVGRPPYPQDTLVALLQRIGAGNFDPPSRIRPDISAVVERAIVRAMQPHPRQRFPHVRDLGRALWEVASPRTQVLWGRVFGDANEAAPSVRTATMRGWTPSPGRESQQNLAPTRHDFVSAPPGPATTRSKLAWIAGAASLALVAAAVTTLLGGRSSPRGEPMSMSTLIQPREVETNAALRPTATPLASSDRPPPVVVAPAAVPPADSAAGKSVAGKSVAGKSVAGDEARDRQGRGVVPPAPRARAGARAMKSELLVVPGAAEAASELEFPGLLRAAPRVSSKGAPRTTSVGANQSPILD